MSDTAPAIGPTTWPAVEVPPLPDPQAEAIRLALAPLLPTIPLFAVAAIAREASAQARAWGRVTPDLMQRHRMELPAVLSEARTTADQAAALALVGRCGGMRLYSPHVMSRQLLKTAGVDCAKHLVRFWSGEPLHVPTAEAPLRLARNEAILESREAGADLNDLVRMFCLPYPWVIQVLREGRRTRATPSPTQGRAVSGEIPRALPARVRPSASPPGHPGRP
ncbi:MAG: hypothetical protein GX442_14610 [Candidatus Riflebacteria bacterium]|nr:hypothetical protein [Candidatus Riflebacteria bacterium]